MKTLNKVTIVFLVLFFAITIPNAGFAAPLTVAFGCADNQIGGGSGPGSMPRRYFCGAFPSGGTPPYTYDWQDFAVPNQILVSSFANSGSYTASPCSGETIAGGIVVVEDSAGNIEVASGIVQLDCPP